MWFFVALRSLRWRRHFVHIRLRTECVLRDHSNRFGSGCDRVFREIAPNHTCCRRTLWL